MNKIKPAIDGINSKLLDTILFLKYFINRILDKRYYIFVFLFSVISYFYSFCRNTINIDDLARDHYIGSGKAMISGLRWGFVIWNRLFSTSGFTQFIDDFFALLFMIFASIIICCVFYSVNQEKNIWIYTVFSSIFISFPLINEIWEYTGTCLAIYGSIAFSSFALLYLLRIENKSLLDFFVCGLLLTPSTSSYESSVFVYISIVISVLFFKEWLSEKSINWIHEGILLAFPLIIAVINKVVFGYILIFLTNSGFSQNGETEINWIANGFLSSMQDVLLSNNRLYLLNFMYFPIAELLVTFLLLSIYTVKKAIISKNYNIVILYGFFIISLFFQSIIQGSEMPYRTAQTIQFFVSFAFFFLITVVKKLNLKKLIICFTILLSLRQSVSMHKFLYLNAQRSEYETNLIHYIGNKLYSGFDLSKPIVFCGKVHLSNFIDSQLYFAKPTTNVNSTINWSMTAFGTQDMMKEYFSYCGFDILVADMVFNDKVLSEYEKICLEKSIVPLEPKDIGDFIVVYFGE